MARSGVLGDRFLEIVAVVMLGAATVGTAWCALQSSLWNGEQEDLAAAAARQQVEANRLFGLGVQTLAYDAGIIAEYAQAVLDEDTKAQRFYRESLMRPELLPFIDRWTAERRSGKAPNLVTDEEYLASLQGPYRQAEDEASTMAQQAVDAGQTGDSYVLTTVLLAIALFFAGVTSSFRYPVVRTALLLGGGMAIAAAAARLIDLPAAQATAELVWWM